MKGRGHALRALAAAALVALARPPGHAHEPAEAANVEALPSRVSALRAAADAARPAATRAAALFALGEELERAVASLNRELAAHGGRLGLAASALVKELAARGFELSPWPEANRYRRILGPFQDYLRLTPAGPREADARFRIIRGRFYDSFVYDPLKSAALDWRRLVAQVAAAEAFLARLPDHPGREEIAFILAVDYLRAAHHAGDRDTVRAYAEKAAKALGRFPERYPESHRRAAAAALSARLPAPEPSRRGPASPPPPGSQ